MTDQKTAPSLSHKNALSDSALNDSALNDSVLNRPIWPNAPLDWEKALYLLLLILAIISRFVLLGDRVVSHDESLHTQFSYQFYSGGGYQHHPMTHGPFLFHITAALYWLFGVSDFASRISTAALGVLLVVMPWFLRRWLGQHGALATAGLILISPYLLYYSRYIRNDIYNAVQALLLVLATFAWLRKREVHWLWWFSGTLAWLFATKEVSYIYVAIFGSFLVLRLALHLWPLPALRRDVQRLVQPGIVLALAALMLLGGTVTGRYLTHRTEQAAGITASPQGSDPSGPQAFDPATDGASHRGSAVTSVGITLAHAVRIGGLYAVLAAAFLIARAYRQELESRPETELIVLYSTLLLPAVSALFTELAGFTWADYSISGCAAIQGTHISSLGGVLTDGACYRAIFTSAIWWNIFFLFSLLVIGVLIGWWWGGKRWLIAAGVFHIVFGLLYTSMFTNTAGGWYSGMVGSLGYWIEQHEVHRGGQPWYYYLVVTTFYEFLPLLLSLLAIRLWLVRQRLVSTAGNGIMVLLAALLAWSFVGWLFNRPIPGPGTSLSLTLLAIALLLAWLALRFWRNAAQNSDDLLRLVQTLLGSAALVALLTVSARSGLHRAEGAGNSAWPGLLAALLVLVAAALWLVLSAWPATGKSTIWPDCSDLTAEKLTGFVPFLIWWTLLAWFGYSYAGERMPWLSVHLALPMTLLGGWYLGQQMQAIPWAAWRARPLPWLLLSATAILVFGGITAQVALTQVTVGSNTRADLQAMGVFFGRLAILALALALFMRLARATSRATLRRVWLFSAVFVLALLTMRSAWLANYVNYDYTNEFLVYAHGAPATKKQVLRQISELSTRLHGDHSIDVRFDSDSSWPMYWYMHAYPNHRFFGSNPGPDIVEAPALIVGSRNWAAVDAIVRDQYVYQTYPYLWWPMEEYRHITWGSFFGINPQQQPDRGLGSRAVRAALWDIFFHRDYTRYGELFGGNYRSGQWPLRSDLRLYLRRDVLANLWDNSMMATAVTPPFDPYEEGEQTPLLLQQFGSQGSGTGQLERPRAVATGNDGQIYVADTGNHRVQVFAPSGELLFGFGSFGADVGQFNEPWGIVVDENAIYVADT
jgi:predicted membrane-bound mannosyltransferase